MSSDEQVYDELHRRLCAGDRVASALFFEALLPVLTKKMRQQFPLTDPQLVSDGVVDAMLQFVVSPQGFDRSQCVGLAGFLGVLSERRIIDRIRKEKTRKSLEAQYVQEMCEPYVVLHHPETNTQANDTVFEARQHQALSQFPDPIDRRVAELYIAGVRPLERYAEVLGISSRPLKDQRRVVKKVKNRIAMALKRRLRTNNDSDQ